MFNVLITACTAVSFLIQTNQSGMMDGSCPGMKEHKNIKNRGKQSSNKKTAQLSQLWPYWVTLILEVRRSKTLHSRTLISKSFQCWNINISEQYRIELQNPDMWTACKRADQSLRFVSTPRIARAPRRPPSFFLVFRSGEIPDVTFHIECEIEQRQVRTLPPLS